MSVDTIIDYVLIFPQETNVNDLDLQCLQLVSNDLKEYLWHKETFMLTSCQDYNNSGW